MWPPAEGYLVARRRMLRQAVCHLMLARLNSQMTGESRIGARKHLGGKPLESVTYEAYGCLNPIAAEHPISNTRLRLPSLPYGAGRSAVAAPARRFAS